MYKYQNVSDVEQSITGDGNISPRIVPAGEFVTSDVAIENPNFKYVGSADGAVQATVIAPQENVVIEASKLDNETNKENQ